MPQGSTLYIINAVLRNDYSNTNPPPSRGPPVSPVDGTAYIGLTVTLQNVDGTVKAINVSPSDFSPPSADQTGVVLASGQTNTVKIYLATNQTGIAQFEINVAFLGDSIQAED